MYNSTTAYGSTALTERLIALTNQTLNNICSPLDDPYNNFWVGRDLYNLCLGFVAQEVTAAAGRYTEFQRSAGHGCTADDLLASGVVGFLITSACANNPALDQALRARDPSTHAGLVDLSNLYRRLLASQPVATPQQSYVPPTTSSAFVTTTTGAPQPTAPAKHRSGIMAALDDTGYQTVTTQQTTITPTTSANSTWKPTKVEPAVSYTPVNPTPTPIQHQAVEFGPDAEFNNTLLMMQTAALDRDERVAAREIPDTIHLDTMPDVVEDFDDFDFDPTAPSLTRAELDEFEYRLEHGGTANGWMAYDPIKHPNARFRPENPFPVAYDIVRQVKYVFVDPQGFLFETVRDKDQAMLMEDHIDDDLSQATAGVSVNVLELIDIAKGRINVSDNRKVPETSKSDEPTEASEAVIASADQVAFERTVFNTLSDTLTEARVAKLGTLRKVVIEGWHERRLSVVYLGENTEDKFDAFRHRIAAAATFEQFVSVCNKEFPHLPESFTVPWRKNLTAHFNEFLYNRLGSGLSVDDLFDDYSDVVTECVELYGESTTKDKFQQEFKTFSRVAKVLPKEASSYSDVLGTEYTAEPGYGVLFTTISTMRLPFESKDAVGILPGPNELHLGVNATVTPQLYELVSKLRKAGAETFNNPAHVVRLITADNVHYYVTVGAFGDGDTFVIHRRSYL